MAEEKLKTDKTVRTKKVRVLGVEEYINRTTGEIVSMQVTAEEERDFNFTKVWLKSLLDKLEIIGNKKTNVAYYIINNLTRENKFIGTQRVIARETGCSLKTVNSVIQELLEHELLRKAEVNGVYMVNPNILYKGSRNGRMNILQQYTDINVPQKEISRSERINNLNKLIEDIKKQITKLEKEEFEQKKGSNEDSIPNNNTNIE